MNQKNEDQNNQNKQSDQTSNILDNDLQTEKMQQNTSKLDRDEWNNNE